MQHDTVREVAGPWSLATSRAFWEGFTPAPLQNQKGQELRTRFRVERDWSSVAVTVRQKGATASLSVTGDGDLEAAAEQAARFLALDVDATGWPEVGDRDPLVGEAQRDFPGLRPCGFYSPYEAAVWAVLSQRVRMTQAANRRRALLGPDGVFPAPAELRKLDLDLFSRQPEYVRAVAEAALDGVLDAAELRALDTASAISRVRQIKGIGPFAAELVVLRGANHPDGIPHHDVRLNAIVAEQYGNGADLDLVAEPWRPFRTWATFHLRASNANAPSR